MRLFWRRSRSDGRHGLGAAVTGIPSLVRPPVPPAEEPPAWFVPPSVTTDPNAAPGPVPAVVEVVTTSVSLPAVSAAPAAELGAGPTVTVAEPLVEHLPVGVAAQPPPEPSAPSPLTMPAVPRSGPAPPVRAAQQTATVPAPAPIAPAVRPAPVRPVPLPRLPARRDLQPTALSAPSPTARPALAAPRVQLGFRDGSHAELDPASAQSRALRELAESLTRRG